ncbi:MAG: hypothetical protein GY944_25905, partial [bacterium]|nr:hypothetical protein [bacterium]
MHAAIRVPAGQRARLERLCRYVLRSAIDEKRLSLTSRGRVRRGKKHKLHFPHWLPLRKPPLNPSAALYHDAIGAFF